MLRFDRALPQVSLNYGRISTPLTTLTKKDAFSWIPEAAHAFEQLKETMWKASDLTTPYFIKTLLWNVMP